MAPMEESDAAPDAEPATTAGESGHEVKSPISKKSSDSDKNRSDLDRTENGSRKSPSRKRKSDEKSEKYLKPDEKSEKSLKSDRFEDRHRHSRSHSHRRHRSRDRDPRRSRSRERDRRDRESRRSRSRDRDDRRRSRDQDDRRFRDRRRSRSRDRRRSRSRDRDERRHRSRHRHRSSSSEKSKSKSKSKSPARSRSRSRSETKFDVLPPNSAQLNMSYVLPQSHQLPQLTKPARRVYVGGLPPMVDEAQIAQFFNYAMATIEGNTFAHGDAVVNVYINHQKNYAFVEMRSVEEASNAMALDGIIFHGVPVRVRRPTDYKQEHAMVFGPTQPSPALRLDKVGLACRALGPINGPERIFIGGIPYEWAEERLRTLLEPYGALRALDIIKDPNCPGKNKGYAFATYVDTTAADRACMQLNQQPLEGKTLKVHRAANGSPSVMVPSMVMLPEVGTKVICLLNAVTEETLKDDGEYTEVLEDMKEECSKYGPLTKVEIPRGDSGSPGVGKVFLEYKDVNSAMRARYGLQGRSFDKRTVQATYYSEDKFAAGDYSA